MPRVLLTTAREREWAEWACDPQLDYYEDLVREGELSAVPAEMPRVDGGELVLPAAPQEPDDPVADLLQRLEDQAADMVDDEAAFRARGGQTAELVAGTMRKPLRRLSEKIRQACPWAQVRGGF